METTRSPHGVPAAPPSGGDGGGITRHSHDQLKTVSDDADRRSPGFRLLYRPDAELGDPDRAEIAFIVERPRSAYRYDIYTRHGKREGVSLETWQSVYKPRSQPIRVPEYVEKTVRAAWQEGKGVSSELGRLHPISEGFQSPALVGEGVA